MKLKQSFVIVLVTILLNVASGKKKDFLVPYAINAIIEKHFVNLETYPGRVDIYFLGKNNLKSSMLIDKLFKIKSASTKVTVYNDELNKNFFKPNMCFALGDSGIVFFESVKKFKQSVSNIWWVKNERLRNLRLVYVPGLTTSDIIKTIVDGFEIDHVNFLMHETDNLIELVTAYMFTPQACKKLQLKTINRFDLQTLEWENSVFYPNKYENFHGCELIVADNDYTDTDIPLYNLMEITFKEQLNAKLTRCSTYKDPLDCKECDLINQDEIILHKTFDDFVVSDPVIFDSYRIIIGPGEPYTDLERMFMMFDFELWIAISVTLATALCATLMLHFVSRKIRNFIVGRYVRNPTMNMISIFLSGGQEKTPRRNFARFLMILFVIWSLIIRTCHQSMLFELMQADLRRPTIKTLDEFFQSDLSYHDVEDSFLIDTYFKEQLKKPSTRLVN